MLSCAVPNKSSLLFVTVLRPDLSAPTTATADASFMILCSSSITNNSVDISWYG